MIFDLPEMMARQRFTVDGVLHVGAHTAQEQPVYESVGAGHVWWVEGNPLVMDVLVDRTAGKDATVIHTLVGAEPVEQVVLHLANNEQSSSVLPLGTHATTHPECVYVGDVVASMSTIDELATAYDIQASFLALDVQGYEAEALAGAEQFLLSTTAVCLEINTVGLYEGCVTFDRLRPWLEQRNFELRELRMVADTGYGDALFVRTV